VPIPTTEAGADGQITDGDGRERAPAVAAPAGAAAVTAGAEPVVRGLGAGIVRPGQMRAEHGDEVARPRGGRAAPKIGRNDPCYCGSGLKYKKCHGR
jgi:preprotein translocase subunit SecA